MVAVTFEGYDQLRPCVSVGENCQRKAYFLILKSLRESHTPWYSLFNGKSSPEVGTSQSCH